MLIGSRHRLSQLSAVPILSLDLNASNLFRPPETLGVVVNECITMKAHTKNVAEEAAKGIGILQKSKNLLDCKKRLKPFIALLFDLL